MMLRKLRVSDVELLQGFRNVRRAVLQDPL